MAERTDILIIGGGTAGLTAAIYAVRAGYSALVLEKAVIGGQIVNTPHIENYPAIGKISGYDFADQLRRQAGSLGARILAGEISSLELSGTPKRVQTDLGEIEAKAVIIANGAHHRKLNVPGEDAFSGRGVSYCATCDGAFFRGKEVAIVGGGNTALQDALFLARGCKTVYLIHRRDAFRAEKTTVNAVQSAANIQVITPAVVCRITGDQVVTGLEIEQAGQKKQLAVAGVFIAVGMEPENELFSRWVELAGGYIKAGEDCLTSCPGVFAAGDTRTKPLRQLVTAAADGAVAAVAAGEYIEKNS